VYTTVTINSISAGLIDAQEKIWTSAKCPFIQDLRSIMTGPGREPARNTCMKRHVEINFHQEQVVGFYREIDIDLIT